MPLNKLEFPEPYKHDHPPVCDAHVLYEEKLTISQRAADWIANAVGSWEFIMWQTIIFGIWIFLNAANWFYHWDPYPFVLMNLVLSLEASFAASIILISQSREDKRDKIEAHQHCQVNEKAEEEVRVILEHLAAQDIALSAIYDSLQELQMQKNQQIGLEL
ncbi:Uncharacterised protein [uncultured archaeon]|nr:Uncharacterised protein [uncultured archaeon]